MKKCKSKQYFNCFAFCKRNPYAVNQCLRHNLGYKQKIIQFIRRNQV